MVKFDIITIFPEIFNGFLNESLLARAQKKSARGGSASGGKKIISIKTHNLREWATDRHQTVDDRPFGGGPGMVMKVEPILKAVKSIKSRGNKTRIILFSPRGKKFDQRAAKRLAKYDQLIFICGRYEGVDERVADYITDETISIGDYVLSGGEVPAMAVIEAVSRLVPGVVGKKESTEKADHAQYTRPEVFEASGKKIRVPKVLLSGNHRKIKEWRERHCK